MFRKHDFFNRSPRDHAACDPTEGHRRHARKPSWLDGDDMPRGRGHGGPHGGPGGRLGRLFAHGDLSLVVLYLLTEKPRHGYEIIKAIEEMTNGAYTPSPGTVYPALTMLEEQGFVEVTPSDGNKKLHTLTDTGRSHLHDNDSTLKALLARLSMAGKDHGHGPSPRLMRAMENLKMALRLRLGAGHPDEAQLQSIVDILDQAARDIERA